MSEVATPRPTAAGHGIFRLDAQPLLRKTSSAAPALLFGVRLWVSVSLALYVAFQLELGNPFWAGTTAAFACQPSLGMSLRKGWFGMMGTILGAVAIVTLSACFPQDRVAFLLGLALWTAACAFLATLPRTLAPYAAVPAGYTAMIIAADQLGATGGVNGDAFSLAITRASDICIGILCAGIVMASTDFGGARRKLASLIVALSVEIAGQLNAMLAFTGMGFADTQSVRRELTRSVIALDQVVDEVVGESCVIRAHSPVVQEAVDGLLAALGCWRTAAALLERLPYRQAREEAEHVLARMPEQVLQDGGPTQWMTNPAQLNRTFNAAARRLTVLAAGAPSLRLLADQTSEALVGLSRALDGVALLMADPARPIPRHHGLPRSHVPDWLPSLINAARAFVLITVVELFWIITHWPSGASAITFAAIGVILLAPRAEQASAAAMSFALGTALGAALAAIIAFAVLPKLQSFAAFSLAIGFVLIPAGAGMAQPRQTAAFTAVVVNFLPLLGPSNPMSYDTAQFYNNALAIVGGLGAAALSFRLIPPLSPAYRIRRLLGLSLRDLRRLIARPIACISDDWKGRAYSRLSAFPAAATPLHRAHLLAALSVGAEVSQLYRTARRLGLKAELDATLDRLARGNVALAITRLGELDSMLLALAMPTALPARARVLAISLALSQHAAYFESGAAR